VTLGTPSGNRFLLVDDLSHYMWVTLVSMKDQAMKGFVAFQARAKAEAGQRLGTLRTNRGGEFTARAFMDHCAKEGIQRHFTAPYTPEQNGVVERRIQRLQMIEALDLAGAVE
jgi:transposase InsO family protein